MLITLKCGFHTFDCLNLMHKYHRREKQKKKKKLKQIPWLWFPIWHYVRYCDESFPEALPKFWRPAGWKKYFFKNTIKKLRSIAFQRCILRGGLPLVEVSQNEDFVQKTASKTAFLRDTKSDQLTLSSHNSCSKHQNHLILYIFEMGQINDFVQILGLKTPI